LEKLSCGVVFNIFIPTDLQICPYLLFDSHGVHKHPPPPNRPPEKIIKDLIHDMKYHNLTLGIETLLKVLQTPRRGKSSSCAKARMGAVGGVDREDNVERLPEGGRPWIVLDKKCHAKKFTDSGCLIWGN
jgi:hypothetical protein